MMFGELEIVSPSEHDIVYRANMFAMSRALDLTGHVYNRLTVIRSEGGGGRWICRCVCGKECSIRLNNLRAGTTKSCGCARFGTVRNVRHGMTGTRTYSTWAAMRNRCANQKNKDYPQWGGRGITVCERWRDSFENFLADMGERPPGKCIGRIDNDGPYSPENCRWESMPEQNRNKRSTVLIAHNGETLCMRDWGKRLGIPESTLYNRHRRGWSSDQILTVPVMRQGERRK